MSQMAKNNLISGRKGKGKRWDFPTKILDMSSSSDSERDDGGPALIPVGDQGQGKTLRRSRVIANRRTGEDGLNAAIYDGPESVHRKLIGGETKDTERSLRLALELSERERIHQADQMDQFKYQILILQEESLRFMENSLDQIEELKRERSDLCQRVLQVEQEWDKIADQLSTARSHCTNHYSIYSRPVLIALTPTPPVAPPPHRHSATSGPRRHAYRNTTPISYRYLLRLRRTVKYDSLFVLGIPEDAKSPIMSLIAQSRHNRCGSILRPKKSSAMAQLDAQRMDALRLPARHVLESKYVEHPPEPTPPVDTFSRKMERIRVQNVVDRFRKRQ